MITTVTATIMDGTAVRWYRDDRAADELVSASRNGVLVRCYLHEVEDVLPVARAAYEMLRANPTADLRHLATHRRVFGSWRLVPVQSGSVL